MNIISERQGREGPSPLPLDPLTLTLQRAEQWASDRKKNGERFERLYHVYCFDQRQHQGAQGFFKQTLLEKIQQLEEKWRLQDKEQEALRKDFKRLSKVPPEQKQKFEEYMETEDILFLHFLELPSFKGEYSFCKHRLDQLWHAVSCIADKPSH
ncbi:MAG: hypothetical protein KGJ02_04065 [Verrucomicrobiota bacterium]|nr:hypothetical protein [Verrucomicrobiota bacterium]